MKYPLNIKKILLFLFVVGLIACSRKKNTFTRRAYHNTTAKYNAYFNAREILRKNVKTIYEEHQDDYSEILPLFIYPTEAQAKSMYPDMDKVIEKSSKVIDKHSIYIKKKEHIRWIDDSYMLIGKARFYKQEFYVGIEVFEYIAKAYKKEPSRNEALIWLARSHMELNEMNKAESFLTLLEDGGVPKEYNSEFNAVYADFFLRKNNYDDAIIKLENALQTTTKKADRQRYTYILAQLWLKKKEYGQASNLFTKVIKLRPEYDLMFNSRINRALAYDVQSTEKNKIKKTLIKMVKDKKNADYLDQIYFALADIAFKEENEPLGIEYLKKSVSSSTSNVKQKALSYLRLGQYYYEIPEYVPSQSYYDSCLAFLPKNHRDYEIIYERGRALTDLVENISIVELEDSLQRMATDESFRKKTIKKLVQDAINEERLKQEELDSDNQLADFSNNRKNTSNNRSKGSWYFYNPTTLGFGFSDFKKNWGDRKLEDDWRRSNKKTTASFNQNTQNDSIANDSSTTIANEKTDPEYYKQFIPFSEEKMNISSNKVIESLYAIGNIYREDFEDYKNAVKTFEELIERYDTCRYVLPSWYNIYRISLLTDDDEMKDKYKTLILNNYPESEYAKIIQDPSYNKVTRENKKRVNLYYSRVYDLYTDRLYNRVLIRCEKAKSIFADNHLRDRFDFLAALAVGHTNSIDSFKIALKNVVKTYPESTVKQEAENILALIEKDKKPEKKAQPKVSYKHKTEGKFIFIVVVPNKDKKVNKYKVDISNFNSKYFSSTKFEPINNIFLDASNQIITVKKLKDYDSAKDYYKSFILNQDNLKELNSKKYKSFIISSENFPLFYKDKNVQTYYDFFLANFDLKG